MNTSLTVSINNPDETIWEGAAQSVSSENSSGPFDILPQHANFLTIVENKPLIVRTVMHKEIFNFPTCVIYTHDNYVSIYTLTGKSEVKKTSTIDQLSREALE